MQIFSATQTWLKPDTLNDGSSLIAAFVNETNEAFSVEFKLSSVLECTIYGKFGYIQPSWYKRDIYIKTKGKRKILETKPEDLPVFFNDSVLQVTIYNTKYSSGGVMDPLVLKLSCQGDIKVFWAVYDLKNYLNACSLSINDNKNMFFSFSKRLPYWNIYLFVNKDYQCFMKTLNHSQSILQ